MSWIFLAALGLLAAWWIFLALRRLDPRVWRRGLRWGIGGVLALVALAALALRRIDMAMVVGAVAASVLLRGRIGQFSFDTIAGSGGGNVSKVRSRYLAMELDHDTGALTGRIVDGRFAGWDLMDLGPVETRALIEEVGHDADSVSLLENWLDANRAGWREYFAQEDAGAGPSASAQGHRDPIAEAYAVLGLQPGASDDEIKTAHRELMKGVHPDRGGSEYLAARINEARDVLLGR